MIDIHPETLLSCGGFGVFCVFTKNGVTEGKPGYRCDHFDFDIWKMRHQMAQPCFYEHPMFGVVGIGE